MRKNKIIEEQVETETDKIKKILEHYEKSKQVFNKFRPKQDDKIVMNVQKIIKEIQEGVEGKGFTSWTADWLHETGVKLSHYYAHLLYCAAEHNARSGFVYAYRKLQHAQSFRPLKAKMKQTLERVTEADVESVLGPMLKTEQEMQIFEQRQADIFKGLANSVERILTFIQQRISDLRKEYDKQTN